MVGAALAGHPSYTARPATGVQSAGTCRIVKHERESVIKAADRFSVTVSKGQTDVVSALLKYTFARVLYDRKANALYLGEHTIG